MLPPITTEPHWVAAPASLQKMIEAISASPLLAIDTESNSLFAYRERVCLIQISTPETDYLIDPLQMDDLSSLAPIFANPAQLKIFHAAEYDIICLKRDYRFVFNNIFDTMIAARILAEPRVGLGSLLETYFGVDLEKKYQRANWGKRPLSGEMLDYARMDTHYLFALKTVLEEKLITQDLWNLAQEDFALVTAVEQPLSDPNGASCWKVVGNNHLSDQESAILQALCNYRDQQAQKMNVPHFKVFSNQLLVELSRSAPHSPEELALVPGVNQKLVLHHGNALLNAIKTGEKAKPLSRPARKKPSAATVERFKTLHEWRKTLAQHSKIESDIVLPREVLERIACLNPGNLSELQAIMSAVPWRFQRYGEEILQQLKTIEEK
ncbi:MAG: HRDC domain-containing protein [Anaerolineaceae bacterium]|nr:HRDC domain-containing protein [Anaerolineaceae bacterium]